jgi:hypothetical protein
VWPAVENRRFGGVERRWGTDQRDRQRRDKLTGRSVGIATTCGLGRRTPEAAARALDRVAELTT